jgi:biofilm PGA synthesis protein PgaD
MSSPMSAPGAAPSAAPIIERPELRSDGRRISDSLITALAWAFWVYLILPLLSLAAWALGLHMFYDEVLAPGRESLSQVLVYLRWAGVAGSVLIAWALYNRLRFGGVDRRRMSAPSDAHRVADYVGLRGADLEVLRARRRVLLLLDTHGRVERYRGERPIDPLVHETEVATGVGARRAS